jgi:hypothetical protein
MVNDTPPPPVDTDAQLPRQARRALDDSLGEYSIVSVQQAANAGSGDEAWCVAVDTELDWQIEFWFYDEDGHDSVRFVWPYDVMIVKRFGDRWQARHIREYLRIAWTPEVDPRSVTEQASSLLSTWGCDNSVTELKLIRE